MGMKIRSIFPTDRSGLLAGLAVAVLLAGTPALLAQDATPAAHTTGQAATPQNTPAQADVTLSNTPVRKKKHHIAKADRVQETKDTKARAQEGSQVQPPHRQGPAAAR